MAGALFGEVLVSLFVAGGIYGEISNDSRSAKPCIFLQQKMLVARGERRKVTSVARRVAD